MCSYSADCRDVKLDCCGRDPCSLCPILRRRRLSLLLNNCVPLVPRLVHLILPLIQRPLLVREPNCDIQSCHMTAHPCGLALFDCPSRQLLAVVVSTWESARDYFQDASPVRMKFIAGCGILDTHHHRLILACCDMQFRLQSLEEELDLVRSESQRNAAELNALLESSSNDC
jgi:hypothetical protein